MHKLSIYLIASLFIVLQSTALSAAMIGLVDWGFNVNGTTYCADSGGTCDVDGGLPGSIDAGGFDFNTGLGTINATLSGAGSYQFRAFFDHEIDQTVNTFFNEYGSAINTPAAGQTWEIDEPGFVFGDIYDNFLDANYDNVNEVPEGLEDDVSLGIGQDFDLGPEETATLMLLLSLTRPTDGFYLSQTDPDSDISLYVSSTLDIQATPAVVPIPAAVWLFGSGLLLLFRVSTVKK